MKEALDKSNHRAKPLSDAESLILCTVPYRELSQGGGKKETFIKKALLVSNLRENSERFNAIRKFCTGCQKRLC